MPKYDALMQESETTAKLDCGCVLSRPHEGTAAITFCSTHRQAYKLLTACKGMFDVIEARVKNAEINDWKEKLQAGRDAISSAETKP